MPVHIQNDFGWYGISGVEPTLGTCMVQANTGEGGHLNGSLCIAGGLPMISAFFLFLHL